MNLNLQKIGQFIQSGRKELGLTQAEIAGSPIRLIALSASLICATVTWRR